MAGYSWTKLEINRIDSVIRKPFQNVQVVALRII